MQQSVTILLCIITVFGERNVHVSFRISFFRIILLLFILRFTRILLVQENLNLPPPLSSTSIAWSSYFVSSPLPLYLACVFPDSFPISPSIKHQTEQSIGTRAFPPLPELIINVDFLFNYRFVCAPSGVGSRAEFSRRKRKGLEKQGKTEKRREGVFAGHTDR